MAQTTFGGGLGFMWPQSFQQCVRERVLGHTGGPPTQVTSSAKAQLLILAPTASYYNAKQQEATTTKQNSFDFAHM